MDFHDRTLELAQLERTWSQTGPQLITLWGRRRVGKTTLLTRFAEGRRGLYFYGTRATEADILRGFSHQAAELLQQEYLREAPFRSWEVALQHLVRNLGHEPWVLVLDEFPYLCEVTAGLDTLVQKWWDTLPTGTAPVVVLAGSGFSFMEGLVGARGPLHGRRTAQVEVRPFDYLDAAHFFPDLQAADRVRAYACFGGSPAYLRFFQKGRSLAENVVERLLSPEHFLFREGEELLRTEFHQEALYASILRAVANGEHRPSDIARAVGRSSADQIFDHLKRLQDLDFLRREVPVTELGRARSQRVLYKLSDPYLRFWFTYVAPFQSVLQLGRGRSLWEQEIFPHFDEFVARTTWEEVCQQFLWREVGLNRLPTRVANLGRWWDAHQEIDVVGMWRSEVTLVGECKWSNATMGSRELKQLQEKAAALPLAKEPCWCLFSRSGFSPELRQRAGRDSQLLLVEPKELFTASG